MQFLKTLFWVLIAVLVLIMFPAWSTSAQLIVGGDALLIHYPWQVLWRDALAAYLAGE